MVRISLSVLRTIGVSLRPKDYAKALKDVSSGKGKEDDDDNPLDDLNEEQIDLLERVAKGRDVSDMSLVEEINQGVFGYPLESQDELKEEGSQSLLRKLRQRRNVST